MNKREKSMKTTAILCLAFFLTLVALSVISVMRKDSNNGENINRKPAPSNAPTGVPSDTTAFITCMILSVEPDDSAIRVHQLDFDEEYTLHYSGSSDIRDSHGRVISATQLKTGDFADIVFESTKILKLKKSADTWCYNNVGNLVVEDSLKRMLISDNIYRYNDSLHILNHDVFIQLDDLRTVDVFDVYGIDDHIYLISVANGHGYLELENYNDFIGGTLYIGGEPYTQIYEGMRLLLSEGEYDVSVENLDLQASKSIKINRYETSLFNLAGYRHPVNPNGVVTLDISPAGAELYINGERQLYDRGISLPYGTHDIEVSLGGFTTYKGTLEVNRADLKVSISLPPSPQDNPDISAKPDSPDDDDSADSDTSESGVKNHLGDPDEDDEQEDEPNLTPTPYGKPDDDNKPDNTASGIPDSGTSQKEYKIVIRCTDGTKVYINDVYVGTIEGGELTSNKITGETTFRLERDGCSPKYYSVTIGNEKSDVVLSFPEMVKNTN